MFTYSERRVTVCHYNDKRSRPGSTMTRWSFDNGQRHVTAFRPVSEAARSWSYDNVFWRFAATWRLVCIHLMSRPNSGCGRGSTITRIVVCFVVVAGVVTLCNDGLPSAKFPSSGGMHVTIDWLQRNYSGTVTRTIGAQSFRVLWTNLFVVWPTMSCFADLSKRRHVTLNIVICSPLHGHPGWHYNATRVTSRDVH